MRPRLCRTVCSIALFGVAAVTPAQDYTLRPGPRGFDPKLNRYGETEARSTAAAGSREAAAPTRTNLTIELLSAAGGGSAVNAQEWSRTLGGLGYSARIRRPLVDDKPEVSERTQGPLRFVSIVGEIDRRGNLVLGDRVFSPSQAAELKDWLDEIKMYGAQGAPEGRPLWGLSPAQFNSAYAALSQRVDGDVAGKSLQEALDSLDLPREHPVVFNAAAKEILQHPAAREHVSRSVDGFTAGTALAFVLNEYGLGFQPERTPEGGIVLSVRPRPAGRNSVTIADPTGTPPFWPVGWEIDDTSEARRGTGDSAARLPDRKQLVPSLYQLKEIGFGNVPLTEVLSLAEEQGGVPVLLDRSGIEAAGVDLAACRVKLDRRTTSWSLALRYATYPHRLGSELRRDEAGNPLVWVSPAR